MKIAVTGGLGFIGSNFIKYVLNTYPEDTIVNIDKETYASNGEYLRGFNEDSRYSFHHGDIASVGDIEKALNDADAIVNFAAESHVDNSINDSSSFVSSNYIGTVNLLNIAKERGMRFNQVSTDEVFGSLHEGRTSRFTETTCYNPRNPYSATKAAADHMALAYYNTYSLPVTVTHSSNNYGPHQHREKLIPKAILSLLENRKIPIYGDGHQVRDWIFVEDNCRAIDAVLRKGDYGQRYIIGGNSEKSNIEVVGRIIELMGKDPNSIEHVRDRPGHDLRYSSDYSRMQRELGWEPRIRFDAGIRLTVKHYTENVKMYCRISQFQQS